MNIDLEYAIKTDIRNNPVVREADSQHGRDLRRTLLLAAVTVAMLLFSVWQRSRVDLAGYRIEPLRAELAREQELNRELRLNLETLRAPQVIEQRAKQLGLYRPSLADTLVIERARERHAAPAIVARAR